jgi:hypothetical protein
MANSYIPCGGDVIYQHFRRLVTQRNIPVEFIQEVLRNSVDEILTCYSIAFDHTKRNVPASFAKKLTRVNDFLKVNAIIDSGGYAINTSKYNLETALRLLDSYYEFLNNYSQLYTRAFVLDLFPGPSSTVFDSYDQVEDLNSKSYELASRVANSIFVFHMFTKEQERISSRLLDKHFDDFKYFSLGGIASGPNSTSKIISYTIGIYKTLKKCIEKGNRKLDFHVLGAGTQWYVVIFELLRKHIQETHGIEVKFTFDSTGYVSEIKKNRQYLHFDGEQLNNINFKSANLGMRVGLDEIVEKKLGAVITSLYGAQTSLGRVYDELGHIDDTISGLLFLCYFEGYKRIQTYIRNTVESIYINMREGNIEDFLTGVYDLSKRFHKYNSLSKNRILEANGLLTSFRLLSSMDDNYYYSICDKNFSIINHISNPLRTI